MDIPLIDLLREELEGIKATALDSIYCFPKAAEMYQSNPDGISVRVKQALARDVSVSGAHRSVATSTTTWPEKA